MGDYSRGEGEGEGDCAGLDEAPVSRHVHISDVARKKTGESNKLHHYEQSLMFEGAFLLRSLKQRHNDPSSDKDDFFTYSHCKRRDHGQSVSILSGGTGISSASLELQLDCF